MSIRFRQALAYPFLPANRKAMLWLPGAAACGLFFVSFLTALAGALLGVDGEEALNPAAFLFLLPLQLGEFLLNVLFSALGLGYCWRLMDRLQREGPEAPGPGWFEDLPGLLLEGLKASLYYLVMSAILAIPLLFFFGALVLLFIVVLGVGFQETSSLPGMIGFFLLVLLAVGGWVAGTILLGPFLLAPMLCSARTRTLGDLFSLDKAWRHAARHYRPAMTGMLYIVLLSLLTGLGMAALVIGTLGLGLLALPFLLFAPYLGMVHLAVQSLPCGTAAIVPSGEPEA